MKKPDVRRELLFVYMNVLELLNIVQTVQDFIPEVTSLVGNSRYGPLHLWSMSLMGHQVVVTVQCNYGPGHLWATT